MGLEELARFGYVTKGIVYLVLGLLALQIGFGSGAPSSNTTGVLRVIAAQPFGKFLLIAVTVGLIGYVFWRSLQAIFDPEHSASTSRRLLPRLGYATSGLSYAGLAVTAVQLLLDRKGDYASTQRKIAVLLSQPFGQWLVGLVGIIIIGVGVSYLYRSCSQQLEDKLNIVEEEYSGAKWAVQIGRFGIAARGFVFCLIGGFTVRSAQRFDPREARGVDGTLKTLAQQPFGKFLMAVVALGFMAYGIHLFVEARYRRFVVLKKPLGNSRV